MRLVQQDYDKVWRALKSWRVLSVGN